MTLADTCARDCSGILFLLPPMAKKDITKSPTLGERPNCFNYVEIVHLHFNIFFNLKN